MNSTVEVKYACSTLLLDTVQIYHTTCEGNIKDICIANVRLFIKTNMFVCYDNNKYVNSSNANLNNSDFLKHKQDIEANNSPFIYYKDQSRSIRNKERQLWFG